MTWDKYYLDICNVIATNSKCLSRKIGAILVKDKSIIATGYNGPPRGVPSCISRYKDLGIKTTEHICPRQALGYKSGEGLEWCVAGHAERNALINAARHGVAVKDSILYMNWGVPCKDCLIELINAGISEIVCKEDTYYDKVSEYLVRTSGIKVRKLNGDLQY